MNTTVQPFITNDTDLGPKADKQLRISILSLILLFSTVGNTLVIQKICSSLTTARSRSAVRLEDQVQSFDFPDQIFSSSTWPWQTSSVQYSPSPV